MVEIMQLQHVLQQNQARMKVLGESFKSHLSALLTEIDNALQSLARIEREFQLSDSRLEDKQSMIGHSQEKLTQLRETGSAIEAKIAEGYSELSEHQRQSAALNATLMEKAGRIDAIESELNHHRARLESQQMLLEEKQKELGRLKAEKDQELSKQKEALKEAENQIKKIQKENLVADYLLSEGLEPPELDILAVLIHRNEVSVSEIKRIAKSPPAITSRVLKEMENKGILKLTSSDTAQLLISV
jgi:chromosome segregation ATPase